MHTVMIQKHWAQDSISRRGGVTSTVRLTINVILNMVFRSFFKEA